MSLFLKSPNLTPHSLAKQMTEHVCSINSSISRRQEYIFTLCGISSDVRRILWWILYSMWVIVVGVVRFVHWGPWAVDQWSQEQTLRLSSKWSADTPQIFRDIFCCGNCRQAGTAVIPWQSACATPNNPHQEALNELDK